MGQGRGHGGSQRLGPGPHLCPPRWLPGVKKERMSNVSQSMTASVA